MDEAAKVSPLTDGLGKSHALRDIAGVDCDRSRVTRCVRVTCLQRGDQGDGKRDVRCFQPFREASLNLVHAKEPLRGKGGRQEEEGRPR